MSLKLKIFWIKHITGDIIDIYNIFVTSKTQLVLIHSKIFFKEFSQKLITYCK